ncbi:MAG: hypothetical protein D3913_12765 [Candidatus Electrothrix sp. LOE1_4_5]|nr:hypothetical protein [Candidatus Electrothrix gigas]
MLLPIFMMEQLKHLFLLLFNKKRDSVAKKSGYTYRLPGRPLQKKRTGRTFLLLLVLLGITLLGVIFFLPFSLQDIGKLIKLPVSSLQNQSLKHHAQGDSQAGLESESSSEQEEGPILRGTIYDRNMEEMAVSYRLFSLFVQPAELANRHAAAKQLALILNMDKEHILQRLQYAEDHVELANDLEIRQVEELEQLHLSGVYCRPGDVRYYPDHAVAGQILGFVSGHTGLSGVEALYDVVVEPGEFRQVNIPAVDFSGYDILGKTVSDIVLTVDMGLQRQLDVALDEYRQRKGASSGSAIAIKPDTGQIVAMVSQPGFDPNYFWQTDEQSGHDALFAPRYHQDLLRPLLVQAAALLENSMKPVLPVTVSTPDYGLPRRLLHDYWLKLGFRQPVPDFLPVSSSQDENFFTPDTDGTHTLEDVFGSSEMLGPMQMIYGVATLLNSGYRVMPWLLHGVYDHHEKRFFLHDNNAFPRKRMLPPVQGIWLRRELLKDSSFSQDEGFLFAHSVSTTSQQNGLSVHHIQEVLLTAVPQEQPEVLLLLTVDYGTLDPYPPEVEHRNVGGLLGVGRNLLPLLLQHAGTVQDFTKSFTKPIPEKNAANLRRYFLSKKLSSAEVKKSLVHTEPIMPSLIGLSLRKGLQQINSYNIKVRIQGSGRIVEQKPAAGELLNETENCELILEKK